MKKGIVQKGHKKSIFKTLFVPLFVIMLFQAVTFYVGAVYGGIQETLRQNAADILNERLINRKNEIETLFTKSWANLTECETLIDQVYHEYAASNGDKPLTRSTEIQVGFLGNVSEQLVDTLRENGVNGIFLILNNESSRNEFSLTGSEEKVESAFGIWISQVIIWAGKI